MDTSQDHKSFMHVRTTFIANTQPTVLMQPADRTLHHPAMPSHDFGIRSASTRNHRLDSSIPQRHPMGHRIVRFIRPQTLGGLTGPTSFPRHRRNGIHQRKKLGHVVTVRRRKDNRKRDAVGIREDVVFRSVFPAIRRVGAGLRPPKTARTFELSATARDQLILLALRRWLSIAWWMSCHTPACCQSRRRLQQVIPQPHPSSWGRSSHPIPVLRTNKIPVRVDRSSTGLRPGYRKRRRLGLGNKGLMSSHNLSSNNGLAMIVPPCTITTSTNRIKKIQSFC